MVQIELKIEGMMCPMCEAHMNEAVKNEYNVQDVTSSHSKGETVIIAEEEIKEESLAVTVEKAGYKMVGYECKPYEKKGFFSKLFKK